MTTHIPPDTLHDRRIREAAHRSAAKMGEPVRAPRHPRILDRLSRQLQDRIRALPAAGDPELRRWVSDNQRLVASTARQTRELGTALRDLPWVAGPEYDIPRALQIARDYLDACAGEFEEASLAAFLDGWQDAHALDIAEIWAVKPTLQLALLERLADAGYAGWQVLAPSLRRLGETLWEDLFESVCRVDRILAADPAQAYAAMDFESRDRYRSVVAELAQHSPRSEREIAEFALHLAGNGHGRAGHVGYYLVDRGLGLLRAIAGYHAPFGQRVRDLVRRDAVTVYLGGVEAATLAIVIFLLSREPAWVPVFFSLPLLLLPATQAAVDFVNNFITRLLPPRALPKLDFSKGIPPDCLTLVVVPTLLASEAQLRELALDLEIRYLGNRDPHVLFALLTDVPDADKPVDDRDALVSLASEQIEALNRRYGSEGRKPFFLLHRHRIYNASEDRWMGWERKRGKLVDLNQYLRGGFDAFGVKVGDLPALSGVRYVITLDSDTQLPPGSAAKLAGAMAHPLNRPVLDPATHMVVEGYGILQPRIGISVHAASRSRLAALYSGQTGFDIYTRAISDVYQDLFGEANFTGKGIYDVDAVRESLEHRFPENTLLSHDLIEGIYARAGLLSDLELVDDYPSHFSAYSRRKHRWVRGDWQIVRWLFPRVQDRTGTLVPNPIPLISRWKIFDNLRRSLLEPAFLALLLAGWLFLPGRPEFWTAATIAMLFLPAWSSLFFSVLRMPLRRRAWMAWAGETLDGFGQANSATLLTIVFLLHQALLAVDAVVRSVSRVFFLRKHLLEWETAADAERQTRRKATVDIYLEWTPWLTALIAVVIWRVRPQALQAALPLLLPWFVSRAISDWMNRPPIANAHRLHARDTELLRATAHSIWRFFQEWSTPASHYLIPDHVREDGEVAWRTSPTNIGLLLNVRIAAVHFGFLEVAGFVAATGQTLDTLEQLPKYRGHLLNWYDVQTLEALEPRFVSTVDSGNLAASLWTLAQAAAAFAREHPTHAADLKTIAARCDRLVGAMDFEFLYHPRKKVLSVGFDTDTKRLEPSAYDLLASEARIATFIAIAKGDVPQEAWFRLGRAHALAEGERVLLSWTGTMFEYLMPALWMKHGRGTLLEQSVHAAVRVQREYARRKGVPWGISESACRGEGFGYGYAAFGIPSLAMKQQTGSLVISPYSTFLALAADPAGAVRNLRRMDEFGWNGRYGFYEAVDYSSAGGDVIRSWMAHHQGMSLLALCNLLFNDPLTRYFHAEPQVLASELLLYERVPAGSLADADAIESPAPAAAPA